MDTLILRQNQLDRIKLFKDKKLIKIITGVRRCGKSTMMNILQNEIKKSTTSNIIYINFEDLKYEDLLDYKKFYQYVEERLSEGKNYLFVDEIQMMDSFEKAINSLFLKDNIDIYLTGSNANMLSSEIATLLSGRYVSIFMLPLGLAELRSSINDMTYETYIATPSFPYAFSLGKKEQTLYMESIIDSVLLNDVIKRYKITDVSTLKRVLRYILAHIGSLISSKKIADALTSSGQKTSVPTIEKYIQALTHSYIIYVVNRYDIQGKEYLKTLQKYYVVDVFMRNMLVAKSTQDAGHILENIVYLELLRREYDISIGKSRSYEVDFVCQKNSEILYIQVSAYLAEEGVMERELRSLKEIKDNHKKLIITLNNINNGDYEGIKIIGINEWLNEKYDI